MHHPAQNATSRPVVHRVPLDPECDFQSSRGAWNRAGNPHENVLGNRELDRHSRGPRRRHVGGPQRGAPRGRHAALRGPPRTLVASAGLLHRIFNIGPEPLQAIAAMPMGSTIAAPDGQAMSLPWRASTATTQDGAQAAARPRRHTRAPRPPSRPLQQQTRRRPSCHLSAPTPAVTRWSRWPVRRHPRRGGQGVVGRLDVLLLPVISRAAEW